MRQLLLKLTRKFPDKVVVVDHNDPLLMLLVIATKNKPIYVIDDGKIPFLEMNLLINDMLPLVKTVTQ